MAKTRKMNPRKTARRRFVSKRRGVGKKAVANIARRVVSEMAEKKQIKTSITNLGIVQAENANFDTQSVIDTSVVLRNLPLGNQSGTRIGQKIKLKRFMFKGTVYQRADVALPVYLKMWVVSDRFNPTNSSTGNIEDACRSGLSQPSSSWFDNGTSTQGMTGGLTDLTLDLEKNRWRVFKTRIFKLATSNPTGYHNNDFKLAYHFKINLLKYSPKVIKYLDALTNTWFTRKVFVVFQPVTLDNVQDPTRALANLNYSINVDYEDF